jgi:hypothetical protein
MNARALAAVLIAATLLAGCRRAPAAPADNEAAIRERLQKKSTAVVVTEAAKTEFTPPADGLLTPAQVETFLKVEERARKIREVAAKAGSAPGDTVAADLRAAQELGVNPKEMTWVSDRVREARTARLGDFLDRRITESRRELLRRLEEEKRTAGPAEQAEIERRIARVSRMPHRVGAPSKPWVHQNAELLAKYSVP